MKKALYLLATAVIASTGHAAEAFPDAFTGTLHKEGDTLVLVRCDVVKSRYVLLERPGAEASLASRLPPSLDTGKASIVATVIGKYSSEGDTHYLTVERFDSIKPGKSCHLEDLLLGP